jgi:hypothetical protein
MLDVKTTARSLVQRLLEARMTEGQAHVREILQSADAEEIYGILQIFSLEDDFGYQRLRGLERLSQKYAGGRMSDEDFVLQVKSVIQRAAAAEYGLGYMQGRGAA